MSKIQVIRKGESLVFGFDLDTTDPTGYVCTISVRQYPDDTATISRVVPVTSTTAGGVTWTGFLTSAETDTLTPGMWILNASLVNASTDEETVIPVRFQITPNWNT